VTLVFAELVDFGVVLSFGVVVGFDVVDSVVPVISVVVVVVGFNVVKVVNDSAVVAAVNSFPGVVGLIVVIVILVDVAFINSFPFPSSDVSFLISSIVSDSVGLIPSCVARLLAGMAVLHSAIAAEVAASFPSAGGVVDSGVGVSASGLSNLVTDVLSTLFCVVQPCVESFGNVSGFTSVLFSGLAFPGADVDIVETIDFPVVGIIDSAAVVSLASALFARFVSVLFGAILIGESGELDDVVRPSNVV